ncbi:hypothetical protein [Burkholderia multivorans]|uniref:hypothetical protein n=1 Tax=Burkholderia multivorans TaxID=87883 RepID=UPI000A83CE49|nr:hypothetical protein [Burkholderia multivorans]
MAICFISPLDSIAHRSFRVAAAPRSAAPLYMAGFRGDRRRRERMRCFGAPMHLDTSI